MRPRSVILLAALIVLLCLTLLLGETGWEELRVSVWERLFGGAGHWNALVDERLPRLIVLFSTGASLAIAGAVMQSLFQNPLAAPSVLGISFGGSLAALLVMLTGWHLVAPQVLPMAACLGCLAALLLVTSLARNHGQLHLHSLILYGIALSTVLIATQRGLLYAMRDNWQLIQAVTEWEAGSSTNRSWQHVNMQAPLCIVGILGCWRYAKELNILSLGDEEASQLGVDVQRVRTHIFLCVALLTGASLAALGGLAFFGLILPHMLRRIIGSDLRALIPSCLIFGGSALVLLDAGLRLSHTSFFSIGNVSAILGGLLFLVLLVQQRRSECYV